VIVSQLAKTKLETVCALGRAVAKLRSKDFRGVAEGPNSLGEQPLLELAGELAM
jgi:hypothetical protein